MFYINNDFFDDFSALFSGGDVVVASEHYPLGHFAATALEIDNGTLRAIEKQLLSFKTEFNVFLTSRDSSSAALAQQELTALWNLLGKLPVYDKLQPQDKSALQLIPYMCEYPDEVDDMLTAGTERNLMMARWLEKLDGLTATLSTFARNTSWMLDEFFERLPNRFPEAYADAFGRYNFAIRNSIEQKEDECEDASDEFSIQFYSIVNISFVPERNPQTGHTSLAEKMAFDDLVSFLHMDLYKGMVAGNLPRRCHNCGHFFLTVGGHNVIYCNDTAPGEKEKTCRTVGAHRKEQQKNQTEFVQKEYSRTYNSLKARKRRGAISTATWNTQVAQIQDLKDAVLKGEIDDGEYKRRLEEF